MAEKKTEIKTDSKAATAKTVIFFDQAHVKNVTAKVKDATVVTDIKISALFTRELAKQFGVEHMLFRERRVPNRSTKKDKPKTKSVMETQQGFDETRLTFEMGPADIVLTPKDGLQQHEIQKHIAQMRDVRVKRNGKGVLTATFKLNYTGSSSEMMNYLEKAGEAPATLKVSAHAEQTSIEDATAEEVEKPKRRARPKKNAGGDDDKQQSIEDSIAARGQRQPANGKAPAEKTYPEPDEDGCFQFSRAERVFDRDLKNAKASVYVLQAGERKFYYGLQCKAGHDALTQPISLSSSDFATRQDAMHAGLSLARSFHRDADGAGVSADAKANAEKIAAAIADELEALKAANSPAGQMVNGEEARV